MSRSQLCWTVVRVIGLLFLFRGTANLVVSIVAPLFLWVLFGEADLPPVGVWVAVLFQSVGWLLLAFYFLRRGVRVHGLLMHDCVVPEAIPILEKAPIDPKTGLPNEELEAFREWRDGNPSVRYLDVEDQVTRYRDFKSDMRRT